MCVCVSVWSSHVYDGSLCELSLQVSLCAGTYLFVLVMQSLRSDQLVTRAPSQDPIHLFCPRVMQVGPLCRLPTCSIGTHRHPTPSGTWLDSGAGPLLSPSFCLPVTDWTLPCDSTCHKL